ncbi:uncharacterized protein Aud_005058 [Aspergillus udagawae]|uniref:Uncharacterized protein n=1 Tax=Aspergillus udagawae TaxID=91492 RepID=A0A8E0UZQ6_9EURO|nr:uncharacterized protein Aud_005058 [Aspergillus udagawae]GIC88661.1 hypothetical protein Aud_005058 [Aspergillus udagawae]
MGLRRELIPTGSATVEDGPYAKEPNASYVAGQTLRLRRKWPNYVTKTAFEDMLGRLRLHKEWWFGHGRTGAMGRVGSLIKEQDVRISGDEEGVVVIAEDALRIKFEELFLRPASGDTEGDLVFQREGLEDLAVAVWSYLPFE